MPEPHWSGRIPVPSGGGASTLVDLTDVTGTPAAGTAPVYNDSGVAPLTPVTTQDDLDAVLTRVAAVDWHDVGAAGEPAFQSQFRNMGDPWSPLRFRIMANSTIRLQGTICCDDQSIADSTWIPIFNLPAECAPGYNLEFCALTNDDAFSRLYVWEDGSVIWAGFVMGPHAPVSRLPLNFISWTTAQPVITAL